MTYKNIKILINFPTLLCSGLLFYVQASHSAPVILIDSDMAQVTAGNYNDGGGVIIGNKSEGIVKNKTGLDISGEAQQSANGLNLVNSIDSAIANTINIWDGRVVTITVEDGALKPVLEINQVNQITQKKNRTATISGYSKPEAEFTETAKRSSSENYLSKIVDSHNTINLFEEIHQSQTISSTNVNTLTKFNLGDKFSFEGNLGQGVAVAGHADITFDGGSVELALSAGAGISVSAGIGQGDSDLTVLGVNLGETEASAGIGISANIALITRVDLPKVNIVIDGAGCGVVMGSCSASSELREFTATRTDNSTLDIVENHQAGQSVFSEEHVQSYRSSFGIESAKAEYIIVDDSSLDLDSVISLELTDTVQKDVKGMNIVNAIGSNVANSTNVSRASQFKSHRSTLVLNQFNTVIHGSQ